MVAVHAPGQMALFEPAAIAPTWPSPGTLAESALALLLDGRELDHPTFEAVTGSWRLAAVVFELRALGWPVQSHDEPRASVDGKRRNVARYSLSARTLANVFAVRGGGVRP